MYDIYRLYPAISDEADLKNLVKEVRLHRSKMKVCPSAQEGVDVPEIIRMFCENDFFKDDYLSITGYFLGNYVPYEKTIETLMEIVKSGLFD